MEKKSRILIVDDEPQLTRVLRTGLKTRGYDVRVAADGIGALETFGDWSPDLVVTDLSMPNMDGLELCSRLRAFSQVPIIVLSAKGEEKIKVEALDAGADDYVTKPFGMDELSPRARFVAKGNSACHRYQYDNRNGDFRVDLSARIVALRGSEIHLTPKEYELLVYLIRNAEKC
jgi:two-component system KDP operon response regulator KdpE